MTNVINLKTKQIKESVNTPDYIFEGSDWKELSDIDFSNVLDESENILPSSKWNIVNNVVILLTRDELENFEESKLKKIEEVKIYARSLISIKILELCKEMGETDYQNNVIWLLILGDERLVTLKTYSITVRALAIAKINEINSCTTWEEFDAITIP